MIASKTPLALGWIELQHVWHAAPASAHCLSVITTSEPASLDVPVSPAAASTPASFEVLEPQANKNEAQRRRMARACPRQGTNRILES